MISNKWLALYTKSRAEKKVFTKLVSIGIECYLPLHFVERQWSDRKKMVEVPLFNSYLFVKTKTKEEYYTVLQCDGAVRFITIEGKASVIPDTEIDTLKFILQQSKEITLEPSYESFKPGEWVEINKGILKGVIGELVEHRGQHKFLIRIGALDQSIVVHVPISQITKLETNLHKS